MQKPKINHKTKKKWKQKNEHFLCDIKKGSFLVDNIKKKNIEYNKNKTADGRESQNKKKEIKSHNLTKYGRAYGG